MTLILGTHIKEDKNKAYKFYSDLHEHDVTHKTIVHAHTHTIFFLKKDTLYCHTLSCVGFVPAHIPHCFSSAHSL